MTKKIDSKKIFSIISLMVPLGFIIYFFTSENGLIDLAKSAASFDWWWIFAAILFQFGNVAIDAYILFRITSNYDKRYTLKKSIKSTAVGQFFSVITPGAIGGQPMQIYCMKKQNVDAGVAMSSLIQKFLVYQTMITFYSLAALIFNFDLFNCNTSGLMISLALFGFISHAAVIAILYMFSFNRKLTERVIRVTINFLAKIRLIKNSKEKLQKIESQLEFFHESNSKLYKNKGTLLLTCTLTFLQLTFIFVIPYAIYRAFNLSGASPVDMITSQAFVTMVSSFTPLPGGSGAAEGSFYVFFSKFFKLDIIKSAILIWRIITYFLNILVFAPFSRVGDASEVKEILENIR